MPFARATIAASSLIFCKAGAALVADETLMLTLSERMVVQESDTCTSYGPRFAPLWR